MVNITKEQKEYLSKYIDNLDDLISKEDEDELLLAIDDEFLNHLDKFDEPTKIGLKLERIRDQLYNQN